MKTAGWAGVLFVVLSGVIVVVAPFWPPLGASAGEVATWYREHRMPFLVGNYLAIAAAVPSFVQLAALSMMIKRAEGEGGWLWIAVLGSVLLAHAAGAMALTAYQTVPFELGAGQEAVAKGLNDFAGTSFATFLCALSGFCLFNSWAVFKTGVLPRWYGGLGVPLVPLCLFASLGEIWSEPRWLAGGGLLTTAVTGLFFWWCGVLAVLMLRMPSTPARLSASPAAPPSSTAS
ncbi:MAG: hypothetical protein QM723_19990 [Myxococcaceae bacterium]